MRRRTMLAGIAPLAGVLLTLSAGAASASAAVTVSRVTPGSGPELAGSVVTIHGTGFSTAPGATVVTFGSEASSSVECRSSRVCKAVTPYGDEGTVPVVVTVGPEASSGSVTFTYERYSPPTIAIEPGNHGPQFSKTRLTDRYPGIFSAGNVYLDIYNDTEDTETFTGPSGTVELPSGSTEGYNIPVDEASPYVFELVGATSPHGTLTVKTKQPR